MGLAAVCDGVGSTYDGAFASNYCTQELQRWFAAAGGERTGLSMRDRVLEINHEIITIAQQKGLDTATTLSAILLAENSYVIVHAGDSRIYHLQGDIAVQITQDDTSPSGKLTACVGRRYDMGVHYEEGDYSEGRFLLCSDGFYRRTDIPAACEELKRAGERKHQKVLERLAKVVMEQGENDNISAIILQKRK